MVLFSMVVTILKKSSLEKWLEMNHMNWSIIISSISGRFSDKLLENTVFFFESDDISAASTNIMEKIFSSAKYKLLRKKN